MVGETRRTVGACVNVRARVWQRLLQVCVRVGITPLDKSLGVFVHNHTGLSSLTGQSDDLTGHERSILRLILLPLDCLLVVK